MKKLFMITLLLLSYNSVFSQYQVTHQVTKEGHLVSNIERLNNNNVIMYDAHYKNITYFVIGNCSSYTYMIVNYKIKNKTYLIKKPKKKQAMWETSMWHVLDYICKN